VTVELGRRLAGDEVHGLPECNADSLFHGRLFKAAEADTEFAEAAADLKAREPPDIRGLSLNCRGRENAGTFGVDETQVDGDMGLLPAGAETERKVAEDNAAADA
jgi:hypothetical protein